MSEMELRQQIATDVVKEQLLREEENQCLPQMVFEYKIKITFALLVDTQDIEMTYEYSTFSILKNSTQD